ncbi:MAG: M48 family metalloprotease [Gammaproteobacteria bacterium]|nr:M48 family metalloprotease [Gammaproteobacteria bacterium]NNL50323.1 M48 family metalloprotease [Woeseiaceae bacterium]
MSINANAVRCDNDLKLFNKLLEEPDVIRINEQLEKHAEDGVVGIRRRLLATSIRLTRGIAKSIHKVADACIDKLELDIPLELYVFPSPQYNAACFKPEAGRLFVIFSSSLLERFVGSELKFVIGHELGHHVYRHHDIPVGHILRGFERPDPKLVLELFAWSRYAEISADRAGAHCAGDPVSVAKALFRLASGLSGDTIDFSLDDFLAQVDEMQADVTEPGRGAPKEDWFSTHPFSPLRVRALQLFHESELATPGGTPKEELEVAVLRLMSLMEPSYMEGHTKAAEAMRRALFSAALTIATVDNEVSEAEIKLFEAFFGKGSYTQKLDIEKLKTELPARFAQVKELTSVPQRMQLINDLCLIAKAEGNVTEPARAMLEQMADELEVPRRFICRTIDTDIVLD